MRHVIQQREHAVPHMRHMVQQWEHMVPHMRHVVQQREHTVPSYNTHGSTMRTCGASYETCCRERINLIIWGVFCAELNNYKGKFWGIFKKDLGKIVEIFFNDFSNIKLIFWPEKLEGEIRGKFEKDLEKILEIFFDYFNNHSNGSTKDWSTHRKLYLHKCSTFVLDYLRMRMFMKQYWDVKTKFFP